MSEDTQPGIQPGMKYDLDKVRAGVLVSDFADALLEVATVTTYGIDKYKIAGSWRRVPNGIERYTDALYRHLLAHAGGELLDQESGLPHLSHAAWNCLAVLQLRMDQDGLMPQYVEKKP